MKIGIIGGGPAGSYCAYLLASAGHNVTVFERNPCREKPCGGGVTEKALDLCPEVKSLPGPYLSVGKLTVFTASGTKASTPVDRPFHIFSRKVLDSSLRELALSAGAVIVEGNVKRLDQSSSGWILNEEGPYEFIVGAGGFADPLVRLKGRSFGKEDTSAMVGYFVPGDFGNEVVIRMLGQRTGYLWVFPRTDHASVGLMVSAEQMHPKGAYHVLDSFMARYYPSVDISRAEKYGAPAPMIMDHSRYNDRPVCGNNWALIGDAAGFCDPLTGEGIYHALASAKYLAEAINSEDVESYLASVKDNLVPELQKAANMKRKFFRPWFWEAAVRLMRGSPTCAAVARDFIAGSQDYMTLRPLTIKLLPKMFLEWLTPGKSC